METTTRTDTSTPTLHHESVLFNECLEQLMVVPGEVVVDATVGGAGHFMALADALGASGTLIGIDADEEALSRARAKIGHSGPRIELVQDNFRNLRTILDTLSVEAIDKSLFDLGWSGFQLARGRGFSFQNDEPLLMTYGDPEAVGTVTASDIVNGYGEEELANLIYEFGEERFSRRIASAIVDARHTARITTTGALVEAISKGIPAFARNGKRNPATKTFQALRIAVNDEYGAIRDGLDAAIARTREGGRIAVITFHSSEDRIVKHLFKDAQEAGRGMSVTKKPIVPSREECLRNPRARSAKLRVFACGVQS